MPRQIQHQFVNFYLISTKSFTFFLQALYPIMDKFGKQRLQDFDLDPTYINLNHGSFGATPKIVTQARRKLENQMEFSPQKWYRLDVENYINETRAFIARYINCPTDNLVFANNTTDAFNCLMKSIKWEPGDVIALPTTSYSAIKKVTEIIQNQYEVEILKIQLTIEDLQSVEKILLKFEDTINQFGKKIKFLILDHIISAPSIICPIEAVTQFCHEKQIKVIIDAAHAVGQLDIDIKQIGCDAYFSNFHKWGFCPKSCTLLYVSDYFKEFVRPVITGRDGGKGFLEEFFWQGTRDYIPFLMAKNGLEYLQFFGKNAVQYHNRELAFLAGQQISKIWGTKPLTSDKRCIGFMNNIEVPCNDFDLAVGIAWQMLKKYNICVVMYQFDGKVFCRVSCQIYNQISDYRQMAEKFLELLNEKLKEKAHEQ